MIPSRLPVVLRVNERDHPLLLEPRRTLLDALRHDLAMTGTKKVCDMGTCGACTVLVDGRAMYACLLLAVDCEGRSIRTIEGLAQGEDLDPVQQAFIERDAFQCGFCTAGQIMSLRGLLDAHPRRPRSRSGGRSPAIFAAAAPTRTSSKRDSTRSNLQSQTQERTSDDRAAD